MISTIYSNLVRLASGSKPSIGEGVISSNLRFTGAVLGETRRGVKTFTGPEPVDGFGGGHTNAPVGAPKEGVNSDGDAVTPNSNGSPKLPPSIELLLAGMGTSCFSSGVCITSIWGQWEECFATLTFKSMSATMPSQPPNATNNSLAAVSASTAKSGFLVCSCSKPK